jgi:hypothetical protein
VLRPSNDGNALQSLFWQPCDTQKITNHKPDTIHYDSHLVRDAQAARVPCIPSNALVELNRREPMVR